MLGRVLRAVAGRALKLSAKTNAISCEKWIEMRTRDGVTLIADRYYPSDGKPRPTVLVRSPYGRGFLLAFSAALMAERGLNVVVQSVRATDGSGGEFDPLRQERDDGADAARWVRGQHWFGGKLYLFGGSYLGWTAWAIATECPELVDGMALTVTHSNVRDAIREGGGLALFTFLTWTRQMHDSITSGRSPFFGGKPVDTAAFLPLPVTRLDQEATGATKPWWQDWVSRSAADPWWTAMDFSPGVTALKAPTLLVGGWQDVFLPYELDDFVARQTAALPTWITIGAWEHGGPGGLFEGQRQAIEFLTGLAFNNPAGPSDRPRVRLFVQGANEWRNYPCWPPADGTQQEFQLRNGRKLSADPESTEGGSSKYCYDPADPTPSIYGPVTSPAKSRDLSPYDARNDVVSFTSDALVDDLEIIGPVSVDLAVRCNQQSVDFYVCLAEVDETGKSRHVCDGYHRVASGTDRHDGVGVCQVDIACWPTAWRFAAGRKLRLYVASACFPRYARNLGTGEPMETATAMAVADVEILHDRTHRSVLRFMGTPGGADERMAGDANG